MAFETIATKSGGIVGVAGSGTVLVAAAIAFSAPPALAVLPVDAHWWRWGAALVVSVAAFTARCTTPDSRAEP